MTAGGAARDASAVGPSVGVDAQLARGTATGIGEYVRGLLGALERRGARVRALEAPGVDPWRFDRRVLWDQALLPLAAARARVDVLHCAAGTMPLACGRPVVATVHDVAWLRVQSHARPYARAYFGAFQLERYRHARVLLVDSEFSRGELLAVAPRIDPGRVGVLYPGVAADVAGVVRRPGAAPFALVVGTVEVRKDLETVVRALAHVPGLRVVSVGPFTPYRERVLAVAAELGVADRVELRGYVDRPVLLDLYARATFAAMPSRYEGFGYGAAQALCAGVPLLAADASSLPEVVAGDAPLVAAGDAAAWAEAMRAVLADRNAAERRAAGARRAATARFAWDAGADVALAAYARAVE